LFHDRGVISIAARSVHLASRRGLTQWHIMYVVLQEGILAGGLDPLR